MRVLVAPDKFKGTLTALEVADTICGGLEDGGLTATALPLADGGDGSVDAALAAGFDRVPVRVRGAAGELVDAAYAYNGHTAVVEVANTCGLATLPPGRLHPMTASSYGFGQAVGAAVSGGARRVVLALGGSASTDGGTGMLAALGVRLCGSGDRAIEAGGAELGRIARLDTERMIDLDGVELVVATDVDNPLLGPRGAAAEFGPQKGAAPDDVRRLDQGLSSLARVMSAATMASEPGAGAAGGLGFACLWLGATRISGADFFLDLLDFDRHVEAHDIVITGEGRLDRQSLDGKLISAVVRRAGGRPVHLLVGDCALRTEDAAVLGVAGVDAITGHTVRDTREDADLSRTLLRELAGVLGGRLAIEPHQPFG
ncbi:glycerate kinase [Nocardioides sp. NPDC101246]|uniref:glycerate kinase n=1 Tax=Nocardioides sp. NPDC101246 TaxID=3364336 RepID=UPI0037F5A3F7